VTLTFDLLTSTATFPINFEYKMSTRML